MCIADAELKTPWRPRLPPSAADVIAIPDVGRMRLMMDPQGAAFYILEPASSERRPEESARDRRCLVARADHDGHDGGNDVLPGVVGWERRDSLDMGPMGMY